MNKIFLTRHFRKMPLILRWVRKFVLATSFPPFLQTYWALYRIPTLLALYLFRKYPAIKAVYLRRGFAKAEGLPGISDIDFAVIANHDEWCTGDKEDLTRAYEKLARMTILLDKGLEVYDEETFYKHYQTNHHFRYRFTEGRQTWRLLYGKDYLATLPTLPIEKMYAGYYTEIKVWWAIFTQHFFQTTEYHRDPVTRNTICYKVVSEIMKMDLLMKHHTEALMRSEAIQLTKPHLHERDKSLVEKLEAIAKKRFLDNDKSILEETKDFLISYLNRFYRELWTHSPSLSLKKLTQQVDCPMEERSYTEKERLCLKQFVEHIKEDWHETYRGAHLVSSVSFSMEELLLMIEIDPERLPAVHQFVGVNRLLREAQTHLKRGLHLFLLFPNAAFQINSEDLKQSWQSILCSPTNPDLFELLNRPEFILDGGDYSATTSSIWTSYLEDFFQEEKNLFYERIEEPSIYKLNLLDFLRIFWKTVQIVLIHRSIQRQEVIYPLTLPAIQRGLDREGIPLPPSLRIMADPYQSELSGRLSEIADLIPSAINYLKEIGS